MSDISLPKGVVLYTGSLHIYPLRNIWFGFLLFSIHGWISLAKTVKISLLEPPSKSPSELGDNVLVGANAVILEGVKVGNNSVVAAGSVVVEDVPENVVVAGSPAKIIKHVDAKTKDKTKLMEDLRR